MHEIITVMRCGDNFWRYVVKYYPNRAKTDLNFAELLSELNAVRMCKLIFWISDEESFVFILYWKTEFFNGLLYSKKKFCVFCWGRKVLTKIYFCIARWNCFDKKKRNSNKYWIAKMSRPYTALPGTDGTHITNLVSI